ncbi:MAG: hypothetical protein KBA50_08115, partial [Sedimentibacter sp.]|nr:hypothetical protein [Sedimentibacter sp.]
NDYYRLINYKIKQVFHTKYPTFIKFSDNKADADLCALCPAPQAACRSPFFRPFRALHHREQFTSGCTGGY